MKILKTVAAVALFLVGAALLLPGGFCLYLGISDTGPFLTTFGIGAAFLVAAIGLFKRGWNLWRS
jgi:hypothetical protein